MIHWFRTIDYCFRFTYVNFLHFLDNDDRMSSKCRNLSALVFLKSKLVLISIGEIKNASVRWQM